MVVYRFKFWSSLEMLGSAIRSKRTDRGWRIDDLASKANLSRRTIMKIEKGDTSVTFTNVLVLMDILGLSLRLIDLNLFVHPHNQITSQGENSVRSNSEPKQSSRSSMKMNGNTLVSLFHHTSLLMIRLRHEVSRTISGSGLEFCF